MGRIISLIGSHHRARILGPMVIAILVGSAGIARADDPPGTGVSAWGWENLAGLEGPVLYTGGANWNLGENYSFAGGLVDQQDGTLSTLPAGTYHLSGEITAVNAADDPTGDREFSCNALAQAQGAPAATVIGTTGGPLPARDGRTAVHAAISRIFVVHAPAQVWIECTGGDDPWTPWDGDDNHEAQGAGVWTQLIATPVNGQLPDWLTGA